MAGSRWVAAPRWFRTTWLAGAVAGPVGVALIVVGISTGHDLLTVLGILPMCFGVLCLRLRKWVFVDVEATGLAHDLDELERAD